MVKQPIGGIILMILLVFYYCFLLVLLSILKIASLQCKWLKRLNFGGPI